MRLSWDERYATDQYAYGEMPNNYLKEKLAGKTSGKILFPADGEGRNSVHAASLGWEAYAFDQSKEGQRKALLLAEKTGVKLHYEVGDFLSFEYTVNQFDAIALIYAHFSASEKSAYHRKLVSYLKPGGLVIFEAFSKGHLAYNSINPAVGGPKDVDTLFSIKEIQADFDGFEVMELDEVEVSLSEGAYHVGNGKVIRFLGRKK